MDCRVIGISRAIGAGGEEVALLVAQNLGFRLIDDEIVSRAAEKAGVSPKSLEKVERSPSLVDRILKYMGNAPMETGFGAYAPPALDASESYEALITQVIRETAQTGNVVILAHGASIPLAGMPGLLRVLITGSVEKRGERLAAAGGVDGAAARKQVETSDKERRDFLQRFYDVRQEGPTHYDLVINTDNISPPSAAELIAAAART